MDHTVLLLMALLTLPVCHCTGTIRSILYVKGVICHVQERVKEKCSRAEPKYNNNRLMCLSKCLGYSKCKGVSLEKTTGDCYIHKQCSDNSNVNQACNTPDADHENYYASYCVHGVWVHDNQACDCSYGNFGDRCDTTDDPSAAIDSEAIDAVPTVNGDPVSTAAPSPCIHGDWNDVEGQCDCPIWASGVNCEDVIDNCDKLSSHPDGDYVVFIDPLQDGKLYRVRCSLAFGYFAILIASTSGGHDEFARGWDDYVNGFEQENARWVGLDAWNAISSHLGCSRLTVILPFDSYGINAILRTYKDFVVGDETTDFEFTFSSSSTNTNGNPGNFEVPDCFEMLQNTPFSTHDRNNDMTSSQNCATKYGFGWWHSLDCLNPCNPLVRGVKSPDWENAPDDFKFTMDGIDMSEVASKLFEFRMYVDCM